MLASSSDGSPISTYQASLFSSSETPDLVVSNTDGKFRNFGTITGDGGYGLLLEVMSSNGAVGALIIFIETENVTAVEVDDVTLSGTLVAGGNLSYTALPGLFEVDASDVEGLTLDTSESLYFNIGTADTTANTELNIELQLTDPNSSRQASLKALNVGLQSGYDIVETHDSLFIFSGEKGSGLSANLETESISNFADIFTSYNGSGLSIDIIQLKNALITALGQDSFAGAISSLEGENLTLTVTIESANDEIFEFSSGDELFNTFVIH